VGIAHQEAIAFHSMVGDANPTCFNIQDAADSCGYALFNGNT
jgi:hypothetical protein